MPLIHEGPRRPIDFEWPGWITHPGVTLNVLFCELSGTVVHVWAKSTNVHGHGTDWPWPMQRHGARHGWRGLAPGEYTRTTSQLCLHTQAVEPPTIARHIPGRTGLSSLVLHFDACLFPFLQKDDYLFPVRLGRVWTVMLFAYNYTTRACALRCAGFILCEK